MDSSLALDAGTSAAPAGAASSYVELPASFFRTVIETANEGIWMVDCEGRTTFANARMGSMLGITAQEMLGRHALEFVFADDLQVAQRVIPATLAGEAQDFEIRF